MGFLDTIGRKLSGSRSNDGAIKPMSSITSDSPAAVQRVPQHVRNRSENQPAHSRSDTVNGGPGTSSSPKNGPRNVDVASTRNIKATENQPQPRQSNDLQRSAPAVQATTSSISPPISRLSESPLGNRQAVSNTNTNTTSPTSSPHAGKALPSNNDHPATHQQQTLQEQPSISSSLHSARPPRMPIVVPNQRAGPGNMPGPPDARQGNMPGSAGRSTARMEDSAYHAGFRDAVAQLERERNGQGQGNGLMN